MNFCIECGYKLEGEFKFCPNCGSKITTLAGSSSESQNSTNKIICKNCGEENSPEHTICFSCGVPLNGSKSKSVAGSSKRKEKNIRNK